MQQTFLPIITQDNRILGMLNLPSDTSFDGTETSLQLDGYSIPLTLVRHQSTNISMPNVEYMATLVTPSEERSNYQEAHWMASFIPYGKWNNQLGIAYKVERETNLLMMLRGINLSRSVTPSVSVVSPTNSTAQINWSTSVNLTGNNAFIEVNWAELVTKQFKNLVPASISIDEQVADPSGGLLKVFVVQSDAPVVNESAFMNTLRFIKITDSPVPKGDYVWSATITNANGSTTTATFTINNV